jgi:ribosomal protein L11 methyltransferase
VKNKSDKWLRVDLSAAPEVADALSNFMTEIGAEGVYQQTLFSSDASADVETEGRGEQGALTAYLPWDKKENRLSSLKTYIEGLSLIFPELAKPTFTTEEIKTSDWGEEWKKYFHPLRVGKNIVIKPTWEAYLPAADDIVIEIDPGMAFGTGQHASTMMCLEAMEDIFAQKGARPEVLDVGTGTGILGIAAAKLGARRVVCIDIDEKAVEIACENAVLNKVEKKLVIRNGDVSSLHKSFNLILANLTAKLLIAISGDLENMLEPGGYLVISGIIDQNRKEIEDCFFRSSLIFMRAIKNQEWLCYIFSRPKL